MSKRASIDLNCSKSSKRARRTLEIPDEEVEESNIESEHVFEFDSKDYDQVFFLKEKLKTNNRNCFLKFHFKVKIKSKKNF